MDKNYAYFYKVLKNMEIKEFNKQLKIDKHECEFDENKQYKDFEDDYFNENLLGWIELIENEKLYQAVKCLPIEDQIFISYIVKEGRTQREVSKIYGITQPAIHKKYGRIMLKMKKYLFKKEN